MTENEALKLMESLVIDPKCEIVKTLDFKATVIKALEDVQAYRAIGTVKGYERAIESSVENYNLYREYRAKLLEYGAIGTVEECRTAVERMKPKKPFGGWEDWTCPTCGTYHTTKQKCCSECMQVILWT